MEQSILASGTEMVTVAMKRIELDNKEDDMLKHIRHPHIQLLPNTSGVRNAEEAVFAAQMAREAFGTNWLNLFHIHPDFPGVSFCEAGTEVHAVREGTGSPTKELVWRVSLLNLASRSAENTDKRNAR